MFPCEPVSGAIEMKQVMQLNIFAEYTLHYFCSGLLKNHFTVSGSMEYFKEKGL